MTKDQITRICSSLGVVTDQFVQVPTLRAILTETNQGLEYHQDFINFNTENEFVEIKEYTPEIKSGIISPNAVISDDEEDNPKQSTLKVSITHAPIWKRDRYYPFRMPKVNDKVIKLSSSGSILESHKIIAVNFKKIYLDSVMNKLETGESLVYLDGATTTAKQDIKNPKLFFDYIPISNNAADIYIQFDAITGFELVSEKVGNGGI